MYAFKRRTSWGPRTRVFAVGGASRRRSREARGARGAGARKRPARGREGARASPPLHARARSRRKGKTRERTQLSVCAHLGGCAIIASQVEEGAAEVFVTLRVRRGLGGAVAVLVLRVAVLRPNGRLLFPLVSGVLRGHVHIFRLGLRVVRCWGDEIILVTRAVLALGVALTLTRGAVLGMHLHVRAKRPGVIRVLDLLVALRRRRFRAVARALLGAGSTDSPESARTLLRRGIRLRGALLRGLRFDCHERCARGRALPVTHRRGGWYRVAHRAR